MAAKRKGGGSKLLRSMTVTVRMDPQLRFAAELASRVQRRTVSSFIEYAVQEAVAREKTEFGKQDGPSIHDVATECWDVDDADRFVKVARHYPELLNFEEQKIWKFISGEDLFYQDGKLRLGFLSYCFGTLKDMVEGVPGWREDLYGHKLGGWEGILAEEGDRVERLEE